MRTLIIVVLLGAASALAGEPMALEKKMLEAELILEFELPFDPEVAKTPGGGANAVKATGPTQAALSRARVVRVLFPAGVAVPAPAPPLSFVASGSNGCVEAALKKGTIRALGFFRKKEEDWVQLYGVEQRLPAYTELDPGWARLLAAVEEAARWRAQTPRAPPPSEALNSDNPFLKRLARAWASRKATPAELFAADCFH
jgi:hypothetical protein